MDRLSRGERRRILKEDEGWMRRPFELYGNPRAIQAYTRHLASMLLDEKLGHRACSAAAFAEQFMDAAIERHVQEPVACATGCTYCCMTFVSATIPEILRLVHALRGRQAKRDDIAAVAEKSRRISQNQRAVKRLACPILEKGLCSEYAARPIVCRSLLSKSLDVCVRVLDQNVDEPFAYANNTVEIRTYVVVMMKAALVLSGLPHQHFEMNQALTVALADEDIEQRWLAGEPVFSGVAIDTADLRPSRLTDLVERLVNVVRPTL